MNIDISELAPIADQLQALDEDDVLLVDEKGVTRYAIIPIETYDSYEAMSSLIDKFTQIQVVVDGQPDIELSYDEYELLKNGMVEMIERLLKPKPEKLN